MLKARIDRKSTRLNSSHLGISYAVFCLKKNDDHRRRLAAWPGQRQVLHAGGGIHRRPGADWNNPRFFNDPPTPEIYPLSLHDGLPICLLFGLAPALQASRADVASALREQRAAL